MCERKSVGFVVFVVTRGVVYDAALELIRDADAAIRKMTKIIDDTQKQDPFADPKSEYFDQDVVRDYEEKREKARTLCSVALNDEEDLEIIEIFEIVPIPFIP